jgi:PAS domain S-box-containing protein
MADFGKPKDETADDPIGSDIGERNRAGQALRKSEEFLKKLITALPDAVTATDLSGRITYASAQGARMMGYDRPEEILGKNSFEFIPAEQQAAAVASLQRVLASGVDQGLRYDLVRKDGSRFPCELSAALIQGADGLPEAMVAITRDISAQRHGEDLIRVQRDLALELGNVSGLQEALDVCLRAALQVSGMEGGGIYLLVEGTTGFELRCHTGLSEEFVGHVAKVEPGSPKAAAVLRGQPIYAQYAQLEVPLHPASEREGLRALAVLPFAHEGHILGCLNMASHRLDEAPPENRASLETLAAQIGTAIARARAEERLREREEQLRQSQKLEAIGTLAGGIAHDFNNLLTGIIGHADLLMAQTRGAGSLHEDLRAIKTAAMRAAELTQQLLGFARKGKMRHEPVDLHLVADEAVAILKRTIDKRVRIERNLRAANPWVMGDPSQLHQVVMNLTVNAAKAMPDGGVLSLATENPAPPAGAAGQLVLRVRDTGIGIPEAIRAHIFEPFFTTKGPTEGIGMGLAVVYGIVTNHGGTIAVDSTPGQGSVFTICLPLASKGAQASEQTVTPRPVASGHGSILLVDDEEVVRGAAARMLERLGYAVHLAADGPTAIEFIRRRRASVDLVILDLAMPGMDGRECYARLREIDPQIRVLIATGYAVEGAPNEMLAQGVRGLLQKPFTLEALAKSVAPLLGK